ncbi:GUN4 domain-containing protein [Fortiea contorta]|uniref:GUN4 domain-containing protein n=1 Tax=Fortiea contorta TaxID=1892405 RepID=UPI00034D55F9|nr:GUN4 domain-containing protein [Fortiea contorta]
MVKNWALVIGINDYDLLQPLKYAQRDAQLIEKLLYNEAGFERVFLFSDNSPEIAGKSTRPVQVNLRRCLQEISKNSSLKAEDNFWFFFSGYGIRHGDDDYLMPADGNPDDVENTAISINYLTECLGCCGCENIVLILDAGHQLHQQKVAGIGEKTQQLAHQRGIISILSCSPQEFSSEIEALQTGLFTYALLEGLGIQGQCASAKRLHQYLHFRVSELTQHYKCLPQTPQIAQSPKSHLILIPKYANLSDFAKQQTHTVPATIEENLELAALSVGAKVVNAVQTAQLRVECSETQTVKAIALLHSEQHIDYTNLRDLLAAGKWQAADRQTLALMLKVAGRTHAGWLDIESINNFPSVDLGIIDQLWLKYSHGRCGFSIQKSIWESIGGDADADYQTWCEFGDRIGWRQHHRWLFYSDLNFSATPPLGHFPAAASVNLLTFKQGWTVGLCSCLVGFSALASRLTKFNS